MFHLLEYVAHAELAGRQTGNDSADFLNFPVAGMPIEGQTIEIDAQTRFADVSRRVRCMTGTPDRSVR
jgi:hypothetical protein